MVKRKRSCMLQLGRRAKDRRVLYVSSAELVGDDIVIHLSKDQSFISPNLCDGVCSVLNSCKNMPHFWSYDIVDHYIPNSNADEIHDSFHYVMEYKKLYGSKALADLVVRSLKRLAAPAAPEVTFDD